MNIYDSEGNLTDEAINIIQTVAVQEAWNHRFGYFTVPDLTQQAWQFAMSKIHKYDGVRPLKTFVRAVIKSRFINYRRDVYHKPQKPCAKCPLFVDKKCSAYEDLSLCALWNKWDRLNASKRALHYFAPYSPDLIGGAQTSSVEWEDFLASLESVLDEGEYAILLSYLNGEKVKPSVLSPILEKIREVVNENYSIES